MTNRRYSVYIMASRRNGTLYVGVTNYLGARAFQHRNGVGSQFTAKYGVKTLVWYEHYGDVREAIAREKQLKKWERKWKLELIERFNPDWRDLYETLNNCCSRSRQRRSTPAFAGVTNRPLLARSRRSDRAPRV